MIQISTFLIFTCLSYFVFIQIVGIKIVHEVLTSANISLVKTLAEQYGSKCKSGRKKTEKVELIEN